MPLPSTLVETAAPTALQLRHGGSGHDISPAATYLASLSAGSRPTAEATLHEIAAFLSGGRLDAFHLPWGALRYEHTTAVRSFLLSRPGKGSARAAHHRSEEALPPARCP